MSALCPAPDPQLGTLLRIGNFLDCNARVLGENGYQALAGNALSSGLVTLIVTVFVAFIGFRLVLGQTPALRDGVGWTARIGIALALATAWPAFQTLVYRVAVDGPVQLASVISAGAGLPDRTFNDRSQRAYDAMRLGAQGELGLAAGRAVAQGTPLPSGAQGYPPSPASPTAATAFLLGGAGLTGALKLVAGFLLAVGPIAMLALIFNATSSLAVGWTRALVGALLGVLGTRLVSALGLLAVEAELARIRALGASASADAIDMGALPAIVALFALAALAAAYAAFRTASAIDWRQGATNPAAPPQWRERMAAYAGAAQAGRSSGDGLTREGGRIATVVGALENAARREALRVTGTPALAAAGRENPVARAANRDAPPQMAQPLGLEGRAAQRRGSGRTSRQARQRDFRE